MTYCQKFAVYEVKIGDDTYAWFKDLEKATERFNFYAAAPDELEDVLTLVESKTGEILKQVNPVEETVEETTEEDNSMTIREYITAGMQDRLEKLVEIGAPAIIIEGQKKAIANPKVGGATEQLNTVITSKEVKTGRGGKQYILFNGNIQFFPNSKYGMYISVK